MTKREYMKNFVAEKTGYTKPMDDGSLVKEFCDLHNANWFDVSCQNDWWECTFIENCVPINDRHRTAWLDEEYREE